MDISELEKGCYVYADDKMVEVVDNLHDDTANTIILQTADRERFRINIERVAIHPIPINKHFLHKHCGFSVDGMLHFEINGNPYSLKSKEDHIILYSHYGNPLIHFWEVKYLHMLQRLYYNLTGDRLAISF